MEAAGFSVRLEGASLFDLIQFECMDRERKVLRVSAHGRFGRLYFRDGNLVHASVGDSVGEAAVRTMLAWRHGHVVHTTASWPANETIGASWQSVLLHAATAQDEVSRIDNVVSLRSRDGSSASGEESMKRERGSEPAHVHDATITASGDVRATGPDREAAETFAYVAELADLVGESLGIERVRSVEVFADTVVAIAVRDTRTGGIRASWAPRHVDAERLRERLDEELG